MKLVKFIKHYRKKDYSKEEMEEFYRKDKILIQNVLDSFDDELDYLDKDAYQTIYASNLLGREVDMLY